MDAQAELYRVVAVTHDFFFYVAQELKIGITRNVIGNEGIMYAINREIEAIQRNISGVVPTYEDDLRQVKRYATPGIVKNTRLPSAAPQSARKLQECSFSKHLVRMTYNSVDTPLVHKMTEEKVAIPKTGAYYKYPPLTTIEFYVLGEKPPTLVRLGKKYPPVRLYHEKLEYSIKKGVFKPSHPVNFQNLKEDTKLIQGTMLLQPPTPLFIDCTLEGTYAEVITSGRTSQNGMCVALPEPRKYPRINLQQES